MNSTQSRMLFLRTADITRMPRMSQVDQRAAIDDDKGYVNAQVTVCTWKNVNLRALLGEDMFFRYRSWNLVPRVFGTEHMLQSGSLDPDEFEDDRCITVVMSGLRWQNNYSLYVNSNVAQLPLFAIQMPSGEGQNQGTIQDVGEGTAFTFDILEGDNCVDITLELRRLYDQEPPILGDGAGGPPHNWVNWFVSFDLYPVEESMRV